jgi:hypothetical protein
MGSMRPTLHSVLRKLRRPRALLLFALTFAIVPPLHPYAPAQPAAFTLDGLRDAGYVLVAEDPPGDLAPAVAAQARFAWADLTRLYAASNDQYLYVYADLPNYTLTHAKGEIGLSLLFPAGASAGVRSDYLRPTLITYAYGVASTAQCAPVPLPNTRHPDVLIRGYIWGGAGDGDNPSNGATFLQTSGTDNWEGSIADWGHISSSVTERHIAYAETAGVELFIPWVDLGLTAPAQPVDLQVSFFTTAGGDAPGNLDAIPSDIQAAASPTATVLSHLASLPWSLPAPASVAIGCPVVSVGESAGPAVVTAQLHTVLVQSVTVSYTTSALTANATDFTPATGTLIFPAGTTQQTIAVPITADTAVEGPETFSLTLFNAISVTQAAPYTATITIIDDDLTVDYRLFVPLLRR